MFEKWKEEGNLFLFITQPVDTAASFLISYTRQYIKNENEKCSEDGGPNDCGNSNFCHLLGLQHESLRDDVSFPHPQWLLNSTPSHTVTVTFFGAQ